MPHVPKLWKTWVALAGLALAFGLGWELGSPSYRPGPIAPLIGGGLAVTAIGAAIALPLAGLLAGQRAAARLGEMAAGWAPLAGAAGGLLAAWYLLDWIGRLIRALG